MRLIVYLLVLCFGPSLSASAHDAGMSLVDISKQSGQVLVEAVFSKSELLSRLRIQNRGETQDESAQQIEAELLRSLRTHPPFRLLGELRVQTPDKLAVHIKDATSIALTATFSANLLTPHTSLQFQSNILSTLAAGHRQQVRVHNSTSERIAIYLLSASNPRTGILAGETISQRTVSDSSSTMKLDTLTDFFLHGMWHIWRGWDHLCFIALLLLPFTAIGRASRKTKFAAIAVLVSLFSVGHSISLALTVFGVVQISASIVEPLILLSVLYAALTCMRAQSGRSHYVLALGFGLIHGLGFADFLVAIAGVNNQLLLSLLGFNLGVESGQLLFVVLALAVLAGIKLGLRALAGRRFVSPAS